MSAAQHLPLVEWDLDSGTQRYSFCDVETPSAFYSPKLLGMGKIVREVPAIGAEYKMSVGELTLDNHDGAFSAIGGSEPTLNRTVRLLYGDASTGLLSSFARIATLKTGVGRCEDNVFTIPLRDPVMDRFQAKVSRFLPTIVPERFPNLPLGTEPRLVPRIYGTVSSVGKGGGGAAPATLIDPAFQENEASPVLFRYLVGWDCDAANVYRYGVLMDPADYTVVQHNYGGLVCCVLDFPADPRDPLRPNDIEITVDVKTGNVGVNPVFALQLFLETDTELVDSAEEADWGPAEDATEACKLDFALLDPEETCLSVIEKICQSGGMSFFVNNEGLFDIFVFDPEAIVQNIGSAPHLHEGLDLVEEDADIEKNNEIRASRLQYNYNWNYVKQFFFRQPDTPDTGEAERLGEDIRESVNFWYLRDDATAQIVAQRLVNLMRENQQYVMLALPPQFYTLDLNGLIRLTHSKGFSTDGSGYVEAIFRIIRFEIAPVSDAMLVRAYAQKLLSVGAPELWNRYFRLGDEGAIAANWSSATASDKTYGYLGDESDTAGSPEGTLGTDEPIKLLM